MDLEWLREGKISNSALYVISYAFGIRDFNFDILAIESIRTLIMVKKSELKGGVKGLNMK